MTSSQFHRQIHSQHICCISLNHHSTPVALRERVRPVQGVAWRDLIASQGTCLRELVVLSTCNRSELYALADCSQEDAAAFMTAFLERANGVPTGEINRYAQFHSGTGAANHLCRVASGLDSKVLGESEILGQVSTAYSQALEEGTVGPALSAVFRTAIRAGRRARRETAIGRNPASVGSAALAMAESLNGPLTARHVLVIGAGEMGASAAAALKNRKVSRVTILNRTAARADLLVRGNGWRAAGLDRLDEALVEADVVVSATACADYVVSQHAVRRAVERRGSRPLLLIDVAVPRDIEPTAGDVPGVRLLDIDALQETLDDALAARQAEVPAVAAIIEEELAQLEDELLRLEIRPLIVDLRCKAEDIRQREVERTLRYLGQVDEETLGRIEHLSRALVNKLLHEPTVHLKSLAAAGHAAEVAPTVRELFGLDHSLEA